MQGVFSEVMPIRKSNDTLFYLIGIIPVVWLALLLAQSLGGGLPELLRNLTSALEQPTNIIWTDKSLPTILICLAAYGMAVLLYRTNQGRTRDGEEHGSAVWATPASVNAQFAQKDSIPLTQHVRLGLDTHKHRRSLNVLVIGGSGAAKTRSFVLPNILTANTNYVITDPKSEVLLATGGYLKKQGYDVRVLNLVNLEQSDGYNPFCYLRDEKDVLKLVNNLIQSTTPKGSHESDPFWTKAETALLQAIILMPVSYTHLDVYKRQLSGGEVAVKLAGSAEKNAAAMLLALARNHKKVYGLSLIHICRRTRQRSCGWLARNWRMSAHESKARRLLFLRERQHCDDPAGLGA